MMGFLWTTEELLRVLETALYQNLPLGISGFSIDTRTLQKGEAFIAIRGYSMDGHSFIEAAYAAGAALCIVEEQCYSSFLSTLKPMIFVPDTLKALEKIGVAARQRSSAKVIAVTGSVGKTTVKNLLSQAIGLSSLVHASPKSFNNHWGVPLTLSRMPMNCAYGVFELGMNHAEEIRMLGEMVSPDLAIITSIGPVHLEHFKDIDAIAAAKAEIFETLKPEGSVLLNRDDSKWPLLDQKARALGIKNIFTFGRHIEADFRLLSMDLNKDHSFVRVQVYEKEYALRIPVPGLPMIYNALITIGATYLLGLSPSLALEAIEHFEAIEGRGKIYSLLHSSGPFTLIDETYNANPVSMREAITTLGNFSSNSSRCIAVLGDMLELGDHSKHFHADLWDILVRSNITCLFLTGDHIKILYTNNLEGIDFVEYFSTIDVLIEYLIKFVRAGDIVMAKASNSMNFKKIVTQMLDVFPQKK